MDINILKRFFEGNYSRKDYEAIRESWVNFEKEQQLKKLMLSHWTEFQTTLPSEEGLEQLLDRIHHRIRLEEAKTGSWKRALHIFERAAAILIIPMILSLVAYFYWESNISNSKEAYAEILCPMGTRTKFILPDGTTGFLNSGSSLLYPVDFLKTRQVELTGEAFFDVAQNHAVGFTVKSKHLIIKAEGTAFDVIAYELEAIEEVILLEGKVEVKEKAGNSITFLMPDQRLTYNHENRLASKSTVIASHYTSWTEGKLVFRNEDMKQVALRLSRWYNVEIVVDNEWLESFAFHATFENEPLDEVLKLLALTTPFVVQEEERRAELDGIFPKRSIIIKPEPI